MKYLTLAGHAEREYAPDKIFAASQKAKAAIAQFGGDAVINSTLGECLDEDGKLMVLPTVERMIRTMPVEEICSYAPIGGIPGFNEAVQISLFGQVSQRFFVESAPTPGLRRAAPRGLELFGKWGRYADHGLVLGPLPEYLRGARPQAGDVPHVR